jgi:alpha-tubulin suppressor-like RCC1 family protein
MVAGVAALAVVLAAAAAPAFAAQQRPGSPAAGHARADPTGEHKAAGRMSPGIPWVHIAAGGGHTCGIRTDGTLWCWGDNDSGELGIGNHTGQDRPRQITTPAAGGWASINATGIYFTCVTRTGGTLWCWGWNISNQLGIGGDTDQELPQQVITPAEGGWASVTAGFDHACAARADGTLWCWGYNDNGELGIGNYTGQDRPRQVTG